MVTRSKTGLILAIIASVLTFGAYFAFGAILDTDIYKEIITELARESRELASMLNDSMEMLSSMMLYFGIANIVLAVLGWRIKFFNGLLAFLGWVYILCGGFVLFLLQGIFCIVASSKNKKYWIELDLLKKIEKEKELRAAVEAKAE